MQTHALTEPIHNPDADKFQLSADQTKATEDFYAFLTDPVESVFVLKGYSGCGKSTLVRTWIDNIPNFMRTANLIDPSIPTYSVQLTATTNKAAENLAQITGEDVKTIHSFLGLRVQVDYESKTKKTTLVARDQHEKFRFYILFIDEASYIDRDLLQLIFEKTEHCKVVFIGDPAQLTPVKSNTTPVFEAKFRSTELREVVRQANGNPIVDLSTMFRHTVNTGVWPKGFKPDGFHVQHLSRPDFDDAIVAEFTRPDWRYHDSKFLAWTNATVIAYNNAIRKKVQGNPEFEVGDYVICNSFISINRVSLKTDQMCHINAISDEYQNLGVWGRDYTLDQGLRAFMPNFLEDKSKRIKLAKQMDDVDTIATIDSKWIDLRAAYACTVNKAQGSTFNEVFIDLDDIGRCNSGNQIARMLYVAISRARNRVFLTGDIT